MYYAKSYASQSAALRQPISGGVFEFSVVLSAVSPIARIRQNFKFYNDSLPPMLIQVQHFFQLTA